MGVRLQCDCHSNLPFPLCRPETLDEGARMMETGNDKATNLGAGEEEDTGRGRRLEENRTAQTRSIAGISLRYMCFQS